jgi:hypothetical protein
MVGLDRPERERTVIEPILDSVRTETATQFPQAQTASANESRIAGYGFPSLYNSAIGYAPGALLRDVQYDDDTGWDRPYSPDLDDIPAPKDIILPRNIHLYKEPIPNSEGLGPGPVDEFGRNVPKPVKIPLPPRTNPDLARDQVKTTVRDDGTGISFSDSNGTSSVTFNFDLQGRLESRVFEGHGLADRSTDPDKNQVQVLKDPNGKIVSVISHRGDITTTYDLDSGFQVTSRRVEGRHEDDKFNQDTHFDLEGAVKDNKKVLLNNDLTLKQTRFDSRESTVIETNNRNTGIQTTEEWRYDINRHAISNVKGDGHSLKITELPDSLTAYHQGPDGTTWTYMQDREVTGTTLSYPDFSSVTVVEDSDNRKTTVTAANNRWQRIIERKGSGGGDGLALGQSGGPEDEGDEMRDPLSKESIVEIRI